jgi:putative NIF3 family GTP cyclohydrolase 1 type 2
MAPTNLQESYDNSGLQLGDADKECSGVLLCVDVTPERVDEAVAKGCNLIISHHPLLFHGLKQIVGATPQQQTVIRAIEAGVAIYSAHTSLDNAPGGVNYQLASDLGLDYVSPLLPISADTPTAGAGGSMIADAVAAGAQAYITSDVRYHDFLDYGDKIFIIDIGHYESESCTKRIFYHIITQKFPNFAVQYSDSEKNPINYI